MVDFSREALIEFWRDLLHIDLIFERIRILSLIGGLLSESRLPFGLIEILLFNLIEKILLLASVLMQPLSLHQLIPLLLFLSSLLFARFYNTCRSQKDIQKSAPSYDSKPAPERVHRAKRIHPLGAIPIFERRIVRVLPILTILTLLEIVMILVPLISFVIIARILL